MIQIEHARREQQDERADEQAEIQVLIFSTTGKANAFLSYSCLCRGDPLPEPWAAPPFGTIVVTEAGSFEPRSPTQCRIVPSAKVWCAFHCIATGLGVMRGEGEERALLRLDFRTSR